MKQEHATLLDDLEHLIDQPPDFMQKHQLSTAHLTLNLLMGLFALDAKVGTKFNYRQRFATDTELQVALWRLCKEGYSQDTYAGLKDKKQAHQRFDEDVQTIAAELDYLQFALGSAELLWELALSEKGQV